MKITRKQLRQWGACYNDAKIAALVPEEGLTPLEIAALDIPAEDRLWVLLREDIIPARELRLLACDWAEAACLKTGWNDARSLAAIAVARRFASGEVSAAELEAAASEARAAWVSALSSSSAAASSAAWSASEARAACASALSSSSAAASSAAWSASEEARSTWAEAWSAAAEEQIADVVRVLKRIDARLRRVR